MVECCLPTSHDTLSCRCAAQLQSWETEWLACAPAAAPSSTTGLASATRRRRRAAALPSGGISSATRLPLPAMLVCNERAGKVT